MSDAIKLCESAEKFIGTIVGEAHTHWHPAGSCALCDLRRSIETVRQNEPVEADDPVRSDELRTALDALDAAQHFITQGRIDLARARIENALKACLSRPVMDEPRSTEPRREGGPDGK